MNLFACGPLCDIPTPLIPCFLAISTNLNASAPEIKISDAIVPSFLGTWGPVIPVEETLEL
jgi:hypothetical protein